MLQITEVAPQVKLLRTGYEEAGRVHRLCCCVLTVSGLTHIFCLTYKLERLKSIKLKTNLSKPTLVSYWTPSSLDSLLEVFREVESLEKFLYDLSKIERDTLITNQFFPLIFFLAKGKLKVRAKQIIKLTSKGCSRLNTSIHP